MKLSTYLKDQFVEILLFIIFVGVVSSALSVMRISMSVIVFFWTLSAIFGVTVISYGFLRKKSFYQKTAKILSELDKKYLLSELIDEPAFFEGKFFYETVWKTNKSMREHVMKSEKQMIDFRDYIELWVHEVKTPLSALSLGVGEDKSYAEKINNYVEQALYYSKINTVDKDYIIKQIDLEKVVNDAIKKNKDALISEKISIKTEGLNKPVHSDAKWLGFVLNQILLNAIKYKSKDPVIEVAAREVDDAVALSIKDNGIGIKQSELKQVFKKGFTGTNGRKIKSSTGMGLYISRKLIEDLGHRITIESQEKEYTKVSIVFGNNDFYETLQKRQTSVTKIDGRRR